MVEADGVGDGVELGATPDGMGVVDGDPELDGEAQLDGVVDG